MARITTQTCKTHQHDDGTIHALSSDGQAVYTVTLGPTPTCTCTAGQYGRRCKHVATAEQRYPHFIPAPWATQRPAARVSDLYAA